MNTIIDEVSIKSEDKEKEIVHCVMCRAVDGIVISAQPYAICGAPNTRIQPGTLVQEDPPANPCPECLFKVPRK